VNGELAALIAVVLHGNAWLADISQPPPALDRDNTTFRYVHSLTFVERRQGLRRRARRIEGTAEWLVAQQNAGVERLTLCSPTAACDQLEPHLASGFANGGPRGLVTNGAARTLWSSGWDTDGGEHPRGEIWQVTMTSLALATLDHEPAPAVPEASAQLMASLEDARVFAIANDLAGWADWFAKASNAAHASEPQVAYNPDIAPPGWLTLEQHQLLAAAVQAWVFGGMGSWNVVWLSDESQADRMARVTERLYAAVVGAVIAVTNGP